MRNKKIIIFSIFLILSGIAIIITNSNLQKFDWYLRSWIITLAYYIIPLGIIILGILALNTVKSKGVKIFLISLWTLLSAVIVFIETIFLVWFIKFDKVKRIDGIEYIGVEYISWRAKKEVYYYSDYNILSYHKTEEYIEDFFDVDDYKIPEFREYHKVPNTDSIIYYYDNKGNIEKIGKYTGNGIETYEVDKE